MTGGGAPEVSVLETPVLMLAGVMAFFLVVTGGFEWVSFNFFFFFAPSIGYAPSLDREARLFFFFFSTSTFSSSSFSLRLSPLSSSSLDLFLFPSLDLFLFPSLPLSSLSHKRSLNDDKNNNKKPRKSSTKPNKPTKKQITHKFRHFLLSRNKLGLLAALDAMMNEILLLGFASLLLLMVQKNVSGLCFAEGDYKLRTWLDSVDGCACCLSRTDGVSGCFLKARGCGSAAAMKACCAPLEGKGRTCDNPSYYEELLSAAGKSAAAAAAKALGGGSGGDLSSAAANAPHRRLRSLLASGGGALLHGAAAAEEETAAADSCSGRAEVGIGGCPPGKRPAVTVTALHEVHGEESC